MNTPQSKTQPLSQRIQQLVKTLQFLWFGAQLIILLLTLRYTLFCIKFSASTKTAAITYRAALTSAIVAYGVVVYRAHFSKRIPSMETLPRLGSDENVQYLLLAALFLGSKPVYALLVPYAIYSLFHVLSYTRTNIIATVAPNSPLGNRIGDLVAKFFDPAMSAVAAVELLVNLPRLLIGVIFRQNSFLLTIAYIVFLRVRWEQSLFVRRVVSGVTTRIDGLVADKNVPQAVRTVWTYTKDIARRYGGVALVPQAQAHAQQPHAQSNTASKKVN